MATDDLDAESGQTLQGSFSAGWQAGLGWAGIPDESSKTDGTGNLFRTKTSSAVSKPNFAIGYACESSRRDLHNALRE